MGQSQSSDLRLLYEQVNDFAIVIRPPGRLNIVNAGRDVVKLLYRILNEESLVNSHRFKYTSSTYKFYIKGHPFSHKGGPTFDFKVTFLRILNALFQELQLVPFISSDLSLVHDTSTVFFKKLKKCDTLGKYAVIAPSGIDSLYLIQLPQGASDRVIDALESEWGLDSDVEEKGPQCFRVKLKGSPWGPGGKGENATALRILLLRIFKIMRSSSYRFVSNISFKGATDDMVFQFDSSLTQSCESFIMYLSKRNRIRFINGPSDLTSRVKDHIHQFWDGGVTSERMHNDALELKVRGSPWKAKSLAAAGSRVLTSTILGEIRRSGYTTVATLDISRRSDDKSIFIFEGASVYTVNSPMCVKSTCLYFSGRNKVMLVGVQSDVLSVLQDCLKPLKRDNGSRHGDVHVWRLSSNVFSYGDNSSKEIFCIILLSIYKRLEAVGWALTSSADVSSNRKRKDEDDRMKSYDAHSWYFLQIVDEETRDVENESIL